ncbi:hypothetical protein DL771_005009 [Monosporascus sp. 5C6A]|nr:hypothetical protein DL771_005009 [Monosporascus sp. 5C6A]
MSVDYTPACGDLERQRTMGTKMWRAVQARTMSHESYRSVLREFMPKDETGNVGRLSEYGSNLGPQLIERNNGEGYVDERQCSVFCHDGDWVEPATDADLWTCDRGGGECKNDERFEDFDECFDNCFRMRLILLSQKTVS